MSNHLKMDSRIELENEVAGANAARKEVTTDRYERRINNKGEWKSKLEELHERRSQERGKKKQVINSEKKDEGLSIDVSTFSWKKDGKDCDGVLKVARKISTKSAMIDIYEENVRNPYFLNEETISIFLEETNCILQGLKKEVGEEFPVNRFLKQAKKQLQQFQDINPVGIEIEICLDVVIKGEGICVMVTLYDVLDE